MAFQDFSLEQLNALNKNTLGEHFGIVFTEIGPDFLRASMPVTPHNVQPLRMLHGGASVAFAETMGSLMGNMLVPEPGKQACLGLEINANHIRPVTEGNMVFGECKALHVGKTTMIFEIKINNQAGKLVCISRLTVAVVTL
jgi:1,4-dihydroxy-2-naphthoyl-CoA hydrolase